MLVYYSSHTDTQPEIKGNSWIMLQGKQCGNIRFHEGPQYNWKVQIARIHVYEQVDGNHIQSSSKEADSR